MAERGGQGLGVTGPAGCALFGRGRETQLITDLVAGASQQGGALVVRGEAGIGKSALRGAELAIDLGRQDLVSRLLGQADPAELSALDLAWWAWIREMSGPGPPGDPAQAPDGGADPGAMRLLGNAAATVWAFDVSEPYVTAAAEGLRTQGKLAVLAQVLVLRAWAEIHLGRWDLARADAHEAASLAAESAQPVWAGGAQAGESLLSGLRRQRRVAESRTPLRAARDAFDILVTSRAQLSTVLSAPGRGR
jgi:hypothetical protein